LKHENTLTSEERNYIALFNQIKDVRTLVFPEWEVFYREGFKVKDRFLLTKKVWRLCVERTGPHSMYTPQPKESLFNLTIVVLILDQPYEGEYNEEKDKKWTSNLFYDEAYQDLKNHHEMRGDVFIMDYKMERIFRKLEALK